MIDENIKSKNVGIYFEKNSMRFFLVFLQT
jgi:hypothetical protein